MSRAGMAQRKNQRQVEEICFVENYGEIIPKCLHIEHQ
jgi:hypothetical protein